MSAGIPERVEADTPLFWSVGPNELRLFQIYTTQFKSVAETGTDELDVPTGDSELPQASVPVYVLAGEDEGWWGGSQLVFPLTK